MADTDYDPMLRVELKELGRKLLRLTQAEMLLKEVLTLRDRLPTSLRDRIADFVQATLDDRVGGFVVGGDAQGQLL